MNELQLFGDVAAGPVSSHINHGHEFMTFPLSVCRLSGTCDIISVITPAALCEGLKQGEKVAVTGELRSYNDREATHNRLKINAWAREITPYEGEHGNTVELTGKLCKAATYRRTPFGREIADMMVCVARPHQGDGPRRFDYIPCIAWGSVARMCAGLEAHAELHILGRIQSRRYMKQIEGELHEKTAYEVSVASAEEVSGEAGAV